ncbi:M23 family metallopeptidase [Effusibacillus lacus]|uniref:M23ase beta-sheet core domain-containing protein n=1 Tax=Effusibacillus lacus TaxID=1348429 RepID=A0A292YHC7_9BACL|nr:M23 family metallopeptidase [Effusibacillus lacus]TCS72301.1 murein DD-endopeptidase MepM/ murein hydrolase activator NlpD [Effusibacillus lacus]GAX90227.1 hypothetical protein EFBL_1853 [Effusibacillus lacus]
MQRNKAWHICTLLVLAIPCGALAKGTGIPAKEPVDILISQEKKIQQEARKVHQELVATIHKIKDLEKDLATGRSKIHQQPQARKLVAVFARTSGVGYIPLLSVSDILPVWSWKDEAFDAYQTQAETREQLLEEKNRLLQQERELRERSRTLSDRISRMTGSPRKEGALDHLDPEKLAGLLAWPVPATKEVSSDYGWRKLNGDVEFHSGIDVAADLGDPIHAAAEGVVLFAGPAQGFGNWVVIRHPQGLLTIYGHMFRNGINVRPGQNVKKGDMIARVGSAGQSYGPHLHFAVATGLKNGSPETVDPWHFLQQE